MFIPFDTLTLLHPEVVPDYALLKPADTARLIGVSRNTVTAIEARDASFPRLIKLSKRRTGYRIIDLLAWMEWVKSRTANAQGLER